MSLDQLVSKNSYPIVFIGSGMSKRYLEGYPSWIDLLEEYWNKLKLDGNFYGVLNEKINAFMKNGKSKEDSEFLVNCEIASYIDEEYTSAFNNEDIIIPGFEPKDSYSSGISPFKYSVSKRFSEYTLIPDMLDEYKLWGDFIRKSQIIITTNYDSLIEDTYSKDSGESLKKYIGQEGFFDDTSGAAELFKIHGCQTDPNSIIINEEDYSRFDKNSILISAKILSSLINSPIIFLGYSMTDCNVRKIISDFTSQLPQEDSRISANRIIIIEHLSGEEEMIEEVIKDREIGSYTLIKTDNYSDVYRKLTDINQGLSPYEIRRYQDVMKKLIISQGTEGALDAVLISPKDIDDLEHDIDMNRPVVVAFGDKKYMYIIPDFLTYMKDYIFEENGIVTSIALEYVASSIPNARIPFARHLLNVSNINELSLDSNVVSKLRKKINNMQTLSELISTVAKGNRISIDHIDNIWSDSELSDKNKIEIIIYNIESLDSDELDEFIKTQAFEKLLVEYPKQDIITTDLRKLFFAYDLLIYGNLNIV